MSAQQIPNIDRPTILDWLEANSRPVKELQTPITVTEVRQKSQLAHLDFWLMLGGEACLILITSSLIQSYMFEPLIFLSIGMLQLGLIANLCRPRTPILVSRPKIIITIQWPHLFSSPKIKTNLTELQRAHGIRPVTHD